MKNRILLSISFLLAACSPGFAQTLEQVDMSVPLANMSTYLTDINNQGVVTGYYTNVVGDNVAFIITARGKKIQANVPGFTNSKAMSVNDNNVVLINASNGGNITPYRAYVDSLGDTLTALIAVTTMQQTSGIPSKMNINNDIAGYYQGPSEKWIFSDRDSLGGWYANRYYDGAFPNYTYYNCYAGGVTNGNIVAGHYIDGITYHPFLYDAAAQTWTLLTGALNKTKIWDINNNNVIVGEYQQGNGYYMGFWATVSGAVMTPHSLNTIFQDPTIQSVVNGVNEKGEMVGAFLDPNTSTWVGFIYRPNNTEYRIPQFNFAHDTWGMINDTQIDTGVFTPHYYGSFDYNTMDPYANNGTPLLDNAIRTQFGITGNWANNRCTDWVSYATEIDRYHTVAVPFVYPITKMQFFDKYSHKSGYHFNGYCYGFSYTALLRHFDDATFSSWFNIPANTDISTIGNSDADAVKAITRGYIKQNHQPIIAKYSTDLYANVGLWEGLYNLKTNYMKPLATSDPRTLSINFNADWRHNVLPYKIHTPQKFPFFFNGVISYDTLFTYDSNFPKDSTMYFLINSTKYSLSHDSVHHKTATSYSPLHYVSFNKASIRETMQSQYSELKGTQANTYDDNLTFMLGSDQAYYSIKCTNATQADYNGAGYSSNASDFLAEQEDAFNTQVPRAFLMDTNKTVTFYTYNYADSLMRWSQNNNMRSMGITRRTLPTERDNSTLKSRFISYGNPDAVTKHFAGYLNQVANDLSQGVNILCSNVSAQPNDSFHTENPSEYVYKITRIGGTGNDTYDLAVSTINNGVLNEFSGTGITFTGNTSHTIDPYYQGPNGPQVVVFIDEGLTGSNSDTLYIAPGAVNLNSSTYASEFIKVYPNPANKYVNVNISNNGNYTIIISDVAGRVQYRKDVLAGQHQLPISSLSVGMYMLTVVNDKGQILHRDKLVKE